MSRGDTTARMAVPSLIFDSSRCDSRSEDQGVWMPRRAKTPCLPRTCFVYLLVHQTENRFKIGKSIRPKYRIAQLPERTSLDWARSLQVKLPDARRASQVESMLHKALAGFRLQRLPWNGSATLSLKAHPWDGATEWFSLPGLRHAIQLLRALPGLAPDAAEQAMQTLEGKPCWPEQQDQRLAPSEQCLLDAERFNLARLEDIHDVLMVIGRRRRITWTPGQQSQPSAGMLRIHDLKTAWDVDMLKARFEVVSSSLWELKSGKPNPKCAYVPLVNLIRYSQEDPGTLELVANAVAPIRRVPGGSIIARRWIRLCEGYEP
jgi:hypothetical protein